MEETWDNEIKPRSSLFKLNLREIINYRDLLVLFIKRDIKVIYKQTVLGPLWFFIQPVLSTIVFTIVFGKLAGISTDGIPGPLFYFSGIVFWNFFSDCLIKTSDAFTVNASLFGKVYFPRLIVPISVVSSNLVKFLIQFLLFLIIYGYYYFTDAGIVLSPLILVVPIVILFLMILGLGLGLIFSSLTTKYRDLKFLLQFGVQLLMYGTPIIYPVSTIPEKLKFWVGLNPLTSLIEIVRYTFLGKGDFNLLWIMYSGGMSLLVLLIGVLMFNKTEKNFMDTV